LDATERKRVVITGGSGFLGVNLARYLIEEGFAVTIVSRNKPTAAGGWAFRKWDGRTRGDWSASIDGAHAVVNLAGRTVDCVKTPLHCDQILRSRVESTRALGLAVQAAKIKPKVWVQMSTAHIYGDSELKCDESSATGYGLAPTVGKAWEEAFDESCPEGVRRVILRTTFVLGKEGAALKKLSLVARLGLGGTISTGKQGISWIHERDMNRVFVHAIEDEAMRGVYIASSPKPVSNWEFMRLLRKAIGMPIGLPAPAWVIRVAAPLVMKTDPELAIYGRYCVPRRLMDEGFGFEYPELDSALRELCGK